MNIAIQNGYNTELVFKVPPEFIGPFMQIASEVMTVSKSYHDDAKYKINMDAGMKISILKDSDIDWMDTKEDQSKMIEKGGF